MEDSNQERQRELRLFLFIVVVLFPILSVVLMGGYGFIVWMSQLLSGPPTY
ncbi:MAG: hypothetical protein AseanaTS_28420 [Candidatus Pelagadaptatus aseana]|uniref:periplasmic nitrate reductase, NapE protein n=1 Tax=Candidatus Pelagadaptatus aseana TaxID=3120508 RepID=UPI0039B22456